MVRARGVGVGLSWGGDGGVLVVGFTRKPPHTLSLCLIQIQVDTWINSR